MTIPTGAQAVIEARKKGFKPAEMLIVSMVGKVSEANHVVYANPESEYDWRWMVGLSACIYVKAGVVWRPTAMAIARTRPEVLSLYDIDRYQGGQVWALPLADDIEKPKSQWRWKLDVLPWAKFQNENFAWGN